MSPLADEFILFSERQGIFKLFAGSGDLFVLLGGSQKNIIEHG
ncbi:MAG TPA: hypothetical protein VK806_14140 [Bacteroidia bacterium]|nr:hypothetical protein [Bacteroidia bacterium]